MIIISEPCSSLLFYLDYTPGTGVVILKGPHQNMCGKVSILDLWKNFKMCNILGSDTLGSK